MTGIYSYDVLPPQFTDKERDTESVLDEFGARYFSSVLGRFVSADPIQHPSQSSWKEALP